MPAFVFAILLSMVSLPVAGQRSIRQVDFGNFTYPLSHLLRGHNQLQWLDLTGGTLKGQSATLVNGADPNSPPNFTLQSVSYADVTGEGNEDAIVVLRLGTGNVAIAHYIYIYSVLAGKPKLLAFCHSGDRGSSALSKAYVDDGQLVIELMGPGDSMLQRRFRWLNGRFQPIAWPLSATGRP